MLVEEYLQVLDFVLVLHRLTVHSRIGLLQLGELEGEVVEELADQGRAGPVRRLRMASSLLEQLLELRNDMQSNQVPCFLAFVVFTLESADLPVVVTDLVFIKLLLLLERVLVLGEQPLGLVVNEIAENLEAVPLLYRLLFEEFSDDGDSRSNFVKLRVPLLQAYQGVVELRRLILQLLLNGCELLSVASLLVALVLMLDLMLREPLSEHRNLLLENAILLLNFGHLSPFFLPPAILAIDLLLKAKDLVQLALSELLELVYAFLFVVVSAEYRVELGEGVLVLVDGALERIVFVDECLIVHIGLLHCRRGVDALVGPSQPGLLETHLTPRMATCIA